MISTNQHPYCEHQHSKDSLEVGFDRKLCTTVARVQILLRVQTRVREVRFRFFRRGEPRDPTPSTARLKKTKQSILFMSYPHDRLFMKHASRRRPHKEEDTENHLPEIPSKSSERIGVISTKCQTLQRKSTRQSARSYAFDGRTEMGNL